MARTKARETYGNGSVSPVMVTKNDANGKPVKVQQRDKSGAPVWRVAISLGTEAYMTKDGKTRKRQRKIQKLFHGSLKEARAYAKTMVETYGQVETEHARGNFSELVKEWAESGTLKCSDRQKEQYLRLLSYVAIHLDSKPVVELKKHDVTHALKATRRPNGSPLAASSQNKLHKVVRRVFGWAVDDMDYLPKNPCPKTYAATQTATTQERNALSAEDAAKLCRYLDEKEAAALEEFRAKEARQEKWGNKFNRSMVRNLSEVSCILAMRLILATGVRRGEAFGLTWKNVDLDEGTIRISQTLTECVEIKCPKTHNGVRRLYIDEQTKSHLRTWKEFQRKALHFVHVEGVAITQSDETPVFCSDRGGWIDPTNAARWWRTFRAGAGFDSLLIHELRHTQATLLKAGGIDSEMIKERLGHSRQYSITDVYTHETPARDREAADWMGCILYGSSAKDSLQKSA